MMRMVDEVSMDSGELPRQYIPSFCTKGKIEGEIVEIGPSQVLLRQQDLIVRDHFTHENSVVISTTATMKARNAPQLKYYVPISLGSSRNNDANELSYFDSLMATKRHIFKDFFVDRIEDLIADA